jgi:hypothetical protein
MSSFFFWRILFLCLTFTRICTSFEITLEEAETIGKRIYFNECSAKAERLVWWNDGENFASLGIGHFIWYPIDQVGPFEETFPALVSFLDQNGIKIPDWLKIVRGCPWQDRQEYLRPEQETKKKELQSFLLSSIPLQAKFIALRFEEIVPQLLSSLDDDQKVRVSRQIKRLGNSLNGKYALLDYLNFKGKGLADSERYQGQGWGLRQVLETMPDDEKDPLQAFVDTAKSLLKSRVKNAPTERHEERWLPGWLARLDSYRVI